MKKPTYLTVSEYAKKHGISVTAVYKRIRTKKIQAIKQYGLILIKTP